MLVYIFKATSRNFQKYRFFKTERKISIFNIYNVIYSDITNTAIFNDRHK